MNLEIGIGGLILLAIEIWAFIKIVSSGASTGKKVLWILFILVVPIIGLICWALFGPKGPEHRLST